MGTADTDKYTIMNQPRGCPKSKLDIWTSLSTLYIYRKKKDGVIIRPFNKPDYTIYGTQINQWWNRIKYVLTL